MKITYYGHSCFLLTIGDNNLLFDPFISPNPLAKEIEIEAIKADYILISHAHEDHLADAEKICQQCDATLISTHEIVTWFGKKGLAKLHGMNTGGKCGYEFGTLKLVNAIHSSSFPDGSYGGTPVGFVIESAEKTIYYSGDTALTFDMKLIKDEFNIDLAILPIGDNYTMGIEDACAAATFVGTHDIFGVHYNTFPPIEISDLESMEIARRYGKKLILLDIGETMEI